MKPVAPPYTITVGELMTELQKFALDRIVIMSKDAEGNSYSPLSSMRRGNYKAETTWSGEAGLEQGQLTPELEKQGFGEEDVIDGVSSVTLYPIN